MSKAKDLKVIMKNGSFMVYPGIVAISYGDYFLEISFSNEQRNFRDRVELESISRLEYSLP